MRRLTVLSIPIFAILLAAFPSSQADDRVANTPPTINSPSSATNRAAAVNTWVKRTPIAGSPVSPRMGYEGACVWDNRHRVLIRYGGHNQGGGGEQGAEVWTLDLETARWTLHEPNTSPPGVCCNAQNIFDPDQGRYVRFPFFSGSHGWQWSRELYMNDSSVWTYDLAENRWRNMRPLPTPRLAPYRCASWDSDEHVIVVFGGEGSSEGTLIYDPAQNEWRWPKPPKQPEGRSGGNMAYDASTKRHILFGSQFSNDVHTWAYDVRQNEWRDLQPAEQPPTDKNDAVLTYDPIHKRVLAIIKVTTGSDETAKHELQTWAYDGTANTWQRMNPASEPEPSGNRARNLTFAPELNLAILENCTSKPREQQVWTYRFADTAAPNTPPPALRPRTIVDDAVVSVISPTRVELTWSAPARGELSAVVPLVYHVERAVVEVYSDDQLKRLKQRTPPLAEPIVGAIRRIGPFTRLTNQPVRETSFVDTAIDLNQPHSAERDFAYLRTLHADQVDELGREYHKGVYAYRIRVVDGKRIARGLSGVLHDPVVTAAGLQSRRGLDLSVEVVAKSRTGDHRLPRVSHGRKVRKGCRIAFDARSDFGDVLRR
jgi:hypothetical protein